MFNVWCFGHYSSNVAAPTSDAYTALALGGTTPPNDKREIISHFAPPAVSQRDRRLPNETEGAFKQSYADGKETRPFSFLSCSGYNYDLTAIRRRSTPIRLQFDRATTNISHVLRSHGTTEIRLLLLLLPLLLLLLNPRVHFYRSRLRIVVINCHTLPYLARRGRRFTA